MKPLTWKREAIGVSEAAWVARHKEGDIEFELYVSDGADGEPGLCDSSPCDAVWHAWLAVGDDIEQADVWMDETGFGPSNLPEAIVRAEQYLRDEMTPQATPEQIKLASRIVTDEFEIHDDARTFDVDGGTWIQCWAFVSDDQEFDEALSASLDQELPGADPEYPVSSRGSASEVACEVCDAVDHATEAHVEADTSATVAVVGEKPAEGAGSNAHASPAPSVLAGGAT